MTRIIIKLILMFTIFIVGSLSFFIAQITGIGAIPLGIIAIGMFAAIRAVWKYNPTSKDIISLKKDN